MSYSSLTCRLTWNRENCKHRKYFWNVIIIIIIIIIIIVIIISTVTYLEISSVAYNLVNY